MLKKFVDDFMKKPLFILSIGVKKSGKSYNTLALLKHAMEHKVFNNYILCLPVFDYEATDSYDFIKKEQKSKKSNIRVFDRYSYLITAEIMKSAKTLKGKRTLIFIDDAMLSSSSIYSPDFYGMLSIARHLGITLIVNYHSLTSGRCLSPFVRQNIEYLCLYKIVSEDLLRMIYDEYLSLATDIKDWKDFRSRYIQHVNGGEYRSLLLNARSGETDWDLKNLTKMIK